MDELNFFLLGSLVMACCVAGMFFLRFWRKTRDRLFALFSAAFWLLGVNWGLLIFTRGNEDRFGGLYILRLAAFLLILVGIVDKNRTRNDA
ncbi:MAG TPA: DUF5985 family protein [Tepidisphaeraceae bacterium]